MVGLRPQRGRSVRLAGRLLTALVLYEPTINLARALVPRWVEDPPRGEPDDGDHDERRDCEGHLGWSGNGHGNLTARCQNSHAMPY